LTIVTTLVCAAEQVAQCRQQLAHLVRLRRQQHRVLRAGLARVLHGARVRGVQLAAVFEQRGESRSRGSPRGCGRAR
jgi:hypothetical protein